MAAASEASPQTDEARSGKNLVQSFRGSAVGREPGIHNHRSGSMDSGLASASLRRPGMTSLTKLTPSVPRVLPQAGLTHPPPLLRPARQGAIEPIRHRPGDRV